MLVFRTWFDARFAAVDPVRAAADATLRHFGVRIDASQSIPRSALISSADQGIQVRVCALRTRLHGRIVRIVAIGSDGAGREVASSATITSSNEDAHSAWVWIDRFAADDSSEIVQTPPLVADLLRTWQCRDGASPLTPLPVPAAVSEQVTALLRHPERFGHSHPVVVFTSGYPSGDATQFSAIAARACLVSTPLPRTSPALLPLMHDKRYRVMSAIAWNNPRARESLARDVERHTLVHYPRMASLDRAIRRHLALCGASTSVRSLLVRAALVPTAAVPIVMSAAARYRSNACEPPAAPLALEPAPRAPELEAAPLAVEPASRTCGKVELLAADVPDVTESPSAAAAANTPGTATGESEPVDAAQTHAPTVVARPDPMRAAIISALDFAPAPASTSLALNRADERAATSPTVLTQPPRHERDTTAPVAVDGADSAEDAPAASPDPAAERDSVDRAQTSTATPPTPVQPTPSAYSRWNAAIADVFYPESNGPKPIFLDLEESRRARLGEIMHVPLDDVEDALSSIVVWHLDRNAPNLFKRFDNDLDHWLSSSRDADVIPGPPPVLPLLAVFSLAAEHMSRDERISPQNYYVRLLSQLHLGETDKARLQNSFRESSERFWRSLAMWLERNGGQRGIPTARPVGPRYVGLPISQALLRDADREVLPSLFAYAGLQPHQTLLPEDLELHIDSWVESRNALQAPQRIKRLWQRGGVPRDALLTTAVSLLASWDGNAPVKTHDALAPRSPELGSPRLALEPPDAFNDLGLIPLIRSGGDLQNYRASVQGAATTLFVRAIADRLYSLGEPGDIDAASLLRSTLQVTLWPPGGDPIRLPQRAPKRIVVFQGDGDQGLFLEVSAVRLGVPVCILATGAASHAVASLLERVAAPGWSTPDSPDEDAGIPEGWTLFEDVRIARVSTDISADPATRDYRYELQALVPPRTGTIQLTGGLRVLRSEACPAYISTQPPKLLVSSDSSTGYKVILEDLDIYEPEDPRVLASVTVPTPRTIDLGEISPSASRYRVTIVDQGASAHSRELGSVRFDLVDPSDSPPERLEQNPLAYVPTAPIGVLSAQALGDSDAGIRGASVGSGLSSRPISVGAPHHSIRPPWVTTLRQRRRHTSIVLPETAEDSCFFTGRHDFIIETPPYNKRGYPVNCWVRGSCHKCGLERFFPSNATMEKRLHELHDRESAVSIEPVERLKIDDDADEPSLMWDHTFDALMYLDTGTWEELRFIASQCSPGRYGPLDLVRSLVSLGLLDVRLSPTTMTEDRWQVPGPCVVPVSWRDEGAPQLFLAGGWSGNDIDLLEDESGEETYEWPLDGAAASPESAFVHDNARVRAVADEQGWSVCPDWSRIAGVLPPLSQVMADLPQAPLDWDGSTVDIFDLETLQWVHADSLDAPGAYRVSNWSHQYLVRTAEDVRRGIARRATSALAKHAAARILNHEPLLAWDQSNDILYVPLGAELPGLYSRAAALASGLPPQIQRVDRRHCLTYSHVPYALAAHLRDLLSS